MDGQVRRRESARDVIRDALIDRILKGTLGPGDRIVERGLAEEFGTSLSPVREALRELESMGYSESRPYSGTYVREIGMVEMADAYQTRACLDKLAGDLFTRRMRAEDLSALQGLQATVQEAVVAGDLAAYARADFAWHREIVTRSGNAVLLRSWDALGIQPRIGPLIRDLGLCLKTLAGEHNAILEAIAARNPQAAGKGLFGHAMGIAKRTIELVEASPTDASESA